MPTTNDDNAREVRAARTYSKIRALNESIEHDAIFVSPFTVKGDRRLSAKQKDLEADWMTVGVSVHLPATADGEAKAARIAAAIAAILKSEGV
jgi:hypothetical protein